MDYSIHKCNRDLSFERWGYSPFWFLLKVVKYAVADRWDSMLRSITGKQREFAS